MSEITLSEINRRFISDQKGFIEESEYEFDKKIELAADIITESERRIPIALLAGPSASGKTTTTKRIAEKLTRRGIKAHIISLDDYYLDVGETTPRDEQGNFDFEAPDCLDLELINRHFTMLAAHGEIELPVFNFAMQKRETETKTLSLGENEVALYEGIHALNGAVTGRAGENAVRLFIRVMSQVFDDTGEMYLEKNLIRLIRRLIRDKNYRSMGAEGTLSMWDSVRKGEHRYILPYSGRASLMIDTFLPYELCVMAKTCEEMLGVIPESFDHYALASRLLDKLPGFSRGGAEEVPASSILREFIGGSAYE